MGNQELTRVLRTLPAIVALTALLGGHVTGWCCLLTCAVESSAVSAEPSCHEESSDGPMLSSGHECGLDDQAPRLVADRALRLMDVLAAPGVAWQPGDLTHIETAIVRSPLLADTGPPPLSPLPLRI